MRRAHIGAVGPVEPRLEVWNAPNGRSSLDRADDERFRGRLPSHHESVIYLTWRLVGDHDVRSPTRRDCDELVWRLGEYSDIPYSRHMLRWGVNDISRPKTAQVWVKWHREHTDAALDSLRPGTTSLLS